MRELGGMVLECNEGRGVVRGRVLGYDMDLKRGSRAMQLHPCDLGL